MVENEFVRKILDVYVEYSTEDEEYGAYYIAICRRLSITTGGRTLDEFTENLKEAIAVTLEDEDTVKRYGLEPNPIVVLTVKMPPDYAKTT